jgi:hypothetical protein
MRNKERKREKKVVVLLEEEIGKKAGSFGCRRCSKADLLVYKVYRN